MKKSWKKMLMSLKYEREALDLVDFEIDMEPYRDRTYDQLIEHLERIQIFCNRYNAPPQFDEVIAFRDADLAFEMRKRILKNGICSTVTNEARKEIKKKVNERIDMATMFDSVMKSKPMGCPKENKMSVEDYTSLLKAKAMMVWELKE